jgi:hypothetical protein
MAESWRAKAKRYSRGDFTNTELKIIIGGMLADQVIDVATFGALSRLKGKALQRVALPLVRKGTVAGARFLPTVARTAGMIAMRHPLVATGAAIYVGYQERERIKQLLDQGYDIIEERLPTPSLPTPSLPSPGPIPGVEEIITGGMAQRFPMPEGLPGIGAFDPMTMLRRPRKPSTFNKAVSAGMKAIKKSTSYGKKGTINPAKKAFSVVVKLAAAKKKKKKAPKSGIRRKIWNAMKGLR